MGNMLYMNTAVTLGSDPELMLWDTQLGRVVSALRIIGKRKNEPISLGDGIRYYADNVLVESAFPPTNSIAAMMSQMKTVWTRLQESLGSRFRLLPKTAHFYDPSELQEKEAWESGCNPSFDAHTEIENLPADFKNGIRTGSFHIHIGHPLWDNFSDRVVAVKLCDIFLGCSSIIFDRDPTSTIRRSLYGRAGEFRETPYGIEYRVLGNWPLQTPKTTELVWDLVAHTIATYDAGEALEIIEAVGTDRIMRAVNGHNQKVARDVLKIAGLPTPLLKRVTEDYSNLPGFHEAWSI